MRGETVTNIANKQEFSESSASSSHLHKHWIQRFGISEIFFKEDHNYLIKNTERKKKQ